MIDFFKSIGVGIWGLTVENRKEVFLILFGLFATGIYGVVTGGFKKIGSWLWKRFDSLCSSLIQRATSGKAIGKHNAIVLNTISPEIVTPPVPTPNLHEEMDRIIGVNLPKGKLDLPPLPGESVEADGWEEDDDLYGNENVPVLDGEASTNREAVLHEFNSMDIEKVAKSRMRRIELLKAEEELSKREMLGDAEFIEKMTSIGEEHVNRWHNVVRPSNRIPEAKKALVELIEVLNEIIPRVVERPHDGKRPTLVSIVHTAENVIENNMPRMNGYEAVFFSRAETVFNMLSSFVQTWNNIDKGAGLPRRIKPVDLQKHGFRIIGEGQAKHSAWNSYRWHCYRCKEWVNEASTTKYGSLDGAPHKYCMDCYRASTRTDYQLV